MLTHALTLCTTVLLLAVTNAENRRVQQMSDGTPAETLVNVGDRRYRKYMELVPNNDGSFHLETRYEEVGAGFPSAQQQGLNNEEKEYQRNPAKSAEKLDPRATWYIPGGQPTFPKLVYALKYGWREVSDEEHMKQLVSLTYTAPWGLEGLRWIEVPYAAHLPESRTKVAIPSSFVPVGSGAANEETRRARRSEDDKAVLVKKFNIKDYLRQKAAENVEVPLNAQSKDATTEKTTAAVSQVEEAAANDEQEASTATGFKNPTPGDEDTETNDEGTAVVQNVEEPVEPAKTNSPTFETVVLGQLVGYRTETCVPIPVKNEESEPLYWIVRALPCAAEPIEGAKVFTTENGQAYAYYGRPELVTLKGEKP